MSPKQRQPCCLEHTALLALHSRSSQVGCVGRVPILQKTFFMLAGFQEFLGIMTKFFLSLLKAIAQVWANYKKLFLFEYRYTIQRQTLKCIRNREGMELHSTQAIS